MCDQWPPHIPGACPQPAPLDLDGLITPELAEEIVREVRIAQGLDPFCPRHGRASRPKEIPGLRCDNLPHCEEK